MNSSRRLSTRKRKNRFVPDENGDSERDQNTGPVAKARKLTKHTGRAKDNSTPPGFKTPATKSSEEHQTSKKSSHSDTQSAAPKGTSKLTCRRCNREFKWKSSLNKHERMVCGGPQKRFACKDCGKEYTRKETLTSHRELVHSGKALSHVCPVCQKTFVNKRNQEVHNMTVHEGKRLYSCPLCNKPFSSKGGVQLHIRCVHMKDRPYNCDRCEKNFSTKRNRDLHVRTVHEGERPHPCHLCTKEFTQKGDLNRHLRTVHRGVHDHVCKQCDKAFLNEEELEKHRRGTCIKNSVADILLGFGEKPIHSPSQPGPPMSPSVARVAGPTHSGTPPPGPSHVQPQHQPPHPAQPPQPPTMYPAWGAAPAGPMVTSTSHVSIAQPMITYAGQPSNTMSAFSAPMNVPPPVWRHVPAPAAPGSGYLN